MTMARNVPGATSDLHSFNSTNFCFRDFEHLLILRMGATDPTDDEWERCLRAVHTHKGRLLQLRVLVVTDGAGPNAHQRGRLSEVLERNAVRIAVVTDSIVVRFINSSVALFTKNIATFNVADIAKAHAYLALSIHERQTAQKAIAEMNQLIGHKRP